MTWRKRSGTGRAERKRGKSERRVESKEDERMGDLGGGGWRERQRVAVEKERGQGRGGGR